MRGWSVLEGRRLRRLRRPGRGARGFTLVELLLVMAIVGVILGAGLGMLTSLNPGERAAVGLVQSTLRAANNSAVARSAPARVRLDLIENTLVAEGEVVVGTWRFEDEGLPGAFGLDGSAIGMDSAPLSEGGFQGRCLDLDQVPRGARVEFPVHEDPAFDPRNGFSIELAVQLKGLARATLLDLGGVVVVEMGSRAQLAATFVAETVGETGEPTKGARISLQTGAGALRLGRWSRVKVRYDRRTLSLNVDGVELARRPETVRVWKMDQGMTLGGGSTVFPGAVDELVISVVAGAEALALPGDVVLGPEAPELVLFAPGGGLEPTAHTGPVSIPLLFADGAQETVQVSRYGTVE